MQPKYKSPFIKISIAIGVDVIVLSAFIIWMHPNADESILEYLFLTAIFVINIGFAVASKYSIRKWYLPLILNSVLAIIVFHLLFSGWYVYSAHKYFKKKRFVSGGKEYELILDRKDTSYSFLKVGTPGKFMGGEYKICNDSIYLLDKLNPMVVYKDSLKGFEKEKIALNEE